jgi:hypothetical protein
MLTCTLMWILSWLSIIFLYEGMIHFKIEECYVLSIWLTFKIVSIGIYSGLFRAAGHWGGFENCWSLEKTWTSSGGYWRNCRGPRQILYSIIVVILEAFIDKMFLITFVKNILNVVSILLQALESWGLIKSNQVGAHTSLTARKRYTYRFRNWIIVFDRVGWGSLLLSCSSLKQ